MNENKLDRGRRSTRLSISIPIVISGVDALGQEFSESVRTLVVNMHGGKILTNRHLTTGAEILIENRAVRSVAKACVVWLSEKHSVGDLHPVGLQLMEAQNVWGIAFPPEDWSGEPAEEQRAEPANPPAVEPAGGKGAATQESSLAGEEITIRALQELQMSSDGYLRDFQDRLVQLSQRLGMELEFELRERAAGANKGEVGALEEDIKLLKKSLSAAREEMGKVEGRIEELKSDLQAATGDAPPPPLQEARRQLAALSNSIVESMNRAAEAGLVEYRNLLEKENQESAARRPSEMEQNPPPPKSQTSQS